MSVICSTRVWEQSETTGSHRLLLLAIADFADENGVAWPGQETLAEMVKMSVSSIRRLISDTVEAGELWRGRRRDGGPNAYIVLVGLSPVNLERAKETVVVMGCSPKDLPTAEQENLILPTGSPDPTAMGSPDPTAMAPDPLLSASEPPKRRALAKSAKARPSSTTPKPAPDPEADYTIHYYHKDKKHVKRAGKANVGPWFIECESCGSDIGILSLGLAVPCARCGMHEYILDKRRPAPVVVRRPEAVEVYYSIIRSVGVKRGANPDYEDDIVQAVTDIAWWKEVVKAYIDPAVGGNPYRVPNMLKYYRERRRPGTKRPKAARVGSAEQNKPKEETISDEDAEYQEQLKAAGLI